MHDITSPEQIFALGKQTNALMERHNVPPSPENYTLWFAYVVGGNRELVAALDEAVASGHASSLHHAGLLHMRFFGHSSSEIFEEIGHQLTVELNKLTESIGESASHAADYGKTLKHAGAELERDTPDITSIVKRLSSATQAVQERNRVLEAKLTNSTKEIHGLRTRMETVREESLTDALTGLANRRCFDDAVRHAIHDSLRDGKAMSLIIADIDHFKKFNDTYGHSVGDQVLRLVAQCLKTNVKGKDLAARFGGEEFVVILPGANLQNAAAVANDIRRSCEAKKIVQRSTGKDMGTVTVSLGVAQFVPGEALADLITRADDCLYAAKRFGRNRVMTELEMDTAKKSSGSAA